MFQRNILDKLNTWKNNPHHKPLVLRGARQVGKTTVINIFSKSFEQYAYFNLELIEDRKLFNDDIQFEELLEAIFYYKNMSRKKKALIFIDEIQNVPYAVSLLRYFYEKSKDIYVIAAGSLLESLIDKNISFPVGRVEYLFMYPLFFDEFLRAIGESETIKLLNTVPIPKFSHQKIVKLFYRYTSIGGMPEIVKTYINDNDLNALSEVYQNLLISYLDDVEKYAKSQPQTKVIRHCIKSAFWEAGNRIRYEGFGNSLYKSREISEAMSILEKAMLLRLIYPSTSVTLPIKPDRKKAPKLLMLDTGLVNYFMGIQKDFFLLDDLNNLYKGKISEHIIAQELRIFYDSPLHEVNFWVRQKKESNAEVDFLVQWENLIIPVEVKAGAAGRLRSLHQFVDKAPHPFAVRFWAGKVQIDKTSTIAGKSFFLLNLPFYTAGKLMDYLTWFINKTENNL